MSEYALLIELYLLLWVIGSFLFGFFLGFIAGKVSI